MLPTENGEAWRAALGQSGYRIGDVRTIRLSGPANAQAAFAAMQGYCDVLLNPQFVDEARRGRVAGDLRPAVA